MIVTVFFPFANKSPEEIQNIVARVQGQEVVIEGCGRTKGIISGILSTNTVPIGLAVTFETMDKARQAGACLTRPPAQCRP